MKRMLILLKTSKIMLKRGIKTIVNLFVDSSLSSIKISCRIKDLQDWKRVNSESIEINKFFSRLKVPYCVFYDEDGEAEVVTPSVIPLTTQQENDFIKIRLEELFTGNWLLLTSIAFMEQVNHLGKPSRIIAQ